MFQEEKSDVFSSTPLITGASSESTNVAPCIFQADSAIASMRYMSTDLQETDGDEGKVVAHHLSQVSTQMTSITASDMSELENRDDEYDWSGRSHRSSSMTSAADSSASSSGMPEPDKYSDSSGGGFGHPGASVRNIVGPTPQVQRRNLQRVAKDNGPLAERQARTLKREQQDACIFVLLLGCKGFVYALLAGLCIGGFAAIAMRPSASSNYALYYAIWAVMAVVGGLLMRTRAAWAEALESFSDISRVHIVIQASESPTEFKAVGRYLEECGLMNPSLRLRIEQDEDDVEMVRLNYSPWARSFMKRGCIYGATGSDTTVHFCTFCPHRWLPRVCCRQPCHGHFEVYYQKPNDWRSQAGTARDRMCGDEIVFSVEDHHSEAIQNFILHAHTNYAMPQRTNKVEVYSAAAADAGYNQGGLASLSWEFMQCIPAMSQERTGRFTYVPGASFARIEQEYHRVVSLGNESLAVLVTGASRAGKSAMVNALAHRLALPIYNLNLKAKYLTDGGIDSLFSYRAIRHRPVLVHIEEFSMMFQETVTRSCTGTSADLPGHGVEGLQSSSTLNCSDLLKLFDQSGTTSPKRILFVLTCIELPEQFDHIRELRPLLARGRLTHYRLEEPTKEVIMRFLLQYFHPEPRRAKLSVEEYQELSRYMTQMQELLGGEFKNWHAIIKYVEVYPLSS